MLEFQISRNDVFIQDVISNSVKHGDAKKIKISLTCSEKKGILTIEDGRRGFSADEAVRGMWLRSIEYRAEAINVIEEAKSENGKGSVLTCSFEHNNCQNN